VVKPLDVDGNVKKINMEKKLKKISKQLKGASKLHAGQAKKIDNMIKKSPAKKRLKVKDMPRKQQMAVKATMAEQSAFKMKGFSGFKSSPTKFKKIPKVDMTLNDNLNKAVRRSEAKEFLRKNTVKPKVKKPLSRPFGPGTRPLARNVSKGLKAFGRRIGVFGALAGVKDIFDGYGKMGKTKTGKRIIKDSRMQPGKI